VNDWAYPTVLTRRCGADASPVLAEQLARQRPPRFPRLHLWIHEKLYDLNEYLNRRGK
jgi:hypothetical protein